MQQLRPRKELFRLWKSKKGLSGHIQLSHPDEFVKRGSAIESDPLPVAPARDTPNIAIIDVKENLLPMEQEIKRLLNENVRLDKLLEDVPRRPSVGDNNRDIDHQPLPVDNTQPSGPPPLPPFPNLPFADSVMDVVKRLNDRCLFR